ncbi:ABC transporter ATP-binding protein [Moheibacter lacus]|uniref:ATP-binding cassette domain-containing protein n=1 Tax=Moheibacter lacus TaxID=2745851 RepID=A0A838ZR22_9FLAO|nr:ATP-binding cassette domain-containing protein [Moheibacter lacus]MBA5628483.1 ATP-binding cassette domain-containing protein [Moheibacter lacus]
MEKVLEINHLTKKFGRMTAVDNLSFSVEKGNVYGLLGPNGSGKSTTLGMILNVVNPTDGHWRWFEKEHSIDSLKKVGAIIERPNFYPYLSAEKNLENVALIKGASKSKIDEKLSIVGLLDRKKDKFSTFSLGMKQRLAIAAAMLNDPDVLILDEPTNGLDPQGIIKIREIILDIAAKGTTIILASHLLDEVEKVCSHVVILEKGKTLYSGRVDEMTASFGYFELSSADNSVLFQALNSITAFDKIAENGSQIKAILKEDLSAESLNRILFEKGIVLTHLVKRKESLENQFLQITQNQN